MRAAPPLALLAALAVALLGAGCAVTSTVREDYEQTDKKTLKRIGVYAPRAPAGAPAVVRTLAERISKRYVNQHKDYLILATGKAHPPGVDGMLLIEMRSLARDGSDVDVELTARLLRAKTGVEVWRAEASKSVESDDEDLMNLVAQYKKELGPAAEPYAAPLFVVLKKVYDTMPTPALTDEDILEKISLEE